MGPLDLVARYVAPHLRALVAAELAARGMGQTRIARLLGVTQPMVAKYLRAGREAAIRGLRSSGVDPEEAEAVARVLAEALARGRVQDYVRISASYEAQLLARGVLCPLHRRLVGGLPADCRVCETLFTSPSDPLVEEVMMAYRRLVEEPGAHLLVPEVGSNIVAARPGARSTVDVVGFTGRIVRVGGRVQAVGAPAYGGSRHTASVLLAVHRRWRRLRACMVAKLLEGCADALGRLGLRYAVAGPHRGPEALLDELREFVAGLHGEVDAIVDLGGPGLEPVVYFFGSTALEAVERALAYLEACRGSVHP